MTNTVMTCILAVFLLVPEVIGQSLAPQKLRCEYRVNPVCLDVTQPRLSWTLTSDQRWQNQKEKG